ncbi:SulP family inorganic anion transporter, partial [Shewanella algae]|uniref:SulP family inorganic anion transporter n=5 Tax=Pseudomonadota TaxID=1224 RepID=UPI00313EB888
AFGLAITIVVRQLPALLGIEAHGATIGALVWSMLLEIGSINAAGATTGIAALASLLLVRRWPRVPGALIVLVLGIAASVVFDLPQRGVSEVG